MVTTILQSLEIKINIASQQLQLIKLNKTIFEAAISSAKNGLGEDYGSECTPRGRHIIRAKIGANAQTNTVFVARRATSEIYSADLRHQYPQRDWILTRIMWLSGIELNKNRLGTVDTMRRFIYIHGCPDEDKMGIPSSHGCIKMHNTDVIALFDLVEVATVVTIQS